MNPFSEKYDAKEDLNLVSAAKNGSRQALEKLVRSHQRYIFNVALSFVKDADEAADLSQEALIKVITKLDQFQGKSSFRSWLYKIVMNHFLKSKKGKISLAFQDYGQFLDEVHVEDEMTEHEHQEYNSEIITTRNKCLSSMLLCLNNEQRIVFILGAIFNVKSNEAANIVGITPENFRKQLSRAKADLFQFMNNKCGLINPSNPCSCSKKTKGFLKEGKLDKHTKTFKENHIESVYEVVGENNEQLDQLMASKYLSLFQSAPYVEREITDQLIASILLDKEVIKVFNLN